MGAIFDEVRKKKNLIKWNKYYVNYVWNRYNVNYSEKTKTILYRKSGVGSADEVINFSDYIDITVDNINKAFMMTYVYYYTPETKLLNNKYVYYYPDGEYGYGGYYLKELNIGDSISDYESENTYIQGSMSFLPNLENSDRYYKSFGNKGFGNSTLIRLNDNTFRFGSNFYECQIQTIKSKGITAYSDVTSTNRNAYQDNGVGKLSTYGSEYWFVYSGSAKGSLIKTVYGKEGQYPDDGIQDGYWYELA